MSFILSPRDRSRLFGVHPDLVRVVEHASGICTSEFIVVEGLRTLEKQREYFQAGKSRTMKSRHLTGHAVDLAPIVDTDGDGDIELSWEPEHFQPIADAMFAAAKDVVSTVEWGGAWRGAWDRPHWQLPWLLYP